MGQDREPTETLEINPLDIMNDEKQKKNAPIHQFFSSLLDLSHSGHWEHRGRGNPLTAKCVVSGASLVPVFCYVLFHDSSGFFANLSAH